MPGKLFSIVRDSILAKAFFFDLYQSLVGGNNQKRIFAHEYVKAKPGDRVLDIGCGPAEILGYMEAVDYLGFDNNPDYIASAKKRFAGKGQFINAGVEDFQAKPDYYDIAIANGVLHHLPDNLAAKLFEVAYENLKKGGRIITLDGCFVEGQSKIDYFLLKNDRGKFVRKKEEYAALAMKKFDKVNIVIRQDLLRIPYTLIIMECTK